MIREFHKEGMILFICPSCGKLYGASYDVGVLLEFRCHICGAEWEMTNHEQVTEYR